MKILIQSQRLRKNISETDDSISNDLKEIRENIENNYMSFSRTTERVIDTLKKFDDEISKIYPHYKKIDLKS